MSPKCTTMVLGISLELLVMVTVTISGLRANRLLILHPYDFPLHIILSVQVQVKSWHKSYDEMSNLCRDRGVIALHPRDRFWIPLTIVSTSPTSPSTTLHRPMVC